MSKLEFYAVALLGLLLVFAGAYFKGRGDGGETERARQEAALARANEKADRLQGELRASARDTQTFLDQMRSSNDALLATARADAARRLCHPAGPTPVPVAGGAAAQAQATAGGGAVPPAVGTDAWREAFITACLHDAEALRGWNYWWDGQEREKALEVSP